MHRTLRSIALVLLPTALAIGCSGGGEGASSGDPASETWATVGGSPITRAEVEEQAEGGLRDLEHQRYELLRGTIEAMAVEKMLEQEAATRGVTLEELIVEEVRNKVAQPTDQEVDEFFAANASRMGSRSLEEMREPLTAHLLEQRAEERHSQFIAELIDRTELDMQLEAPRIEFDVPADSHTRGPEDAPVTFVEFGDFECPYCRRAHPSVARLLNEYGDKVRYAFIDFPLGNHRRAVPASAAARCAEEQGRYWEYFENLMVMQGDLSDADLRKRALDLGLDVDAFDRCVESPDHLQELQARLEWAADLGVRRTPTFFVNGRMVVGAKTYYEMKHIVDEELERVDDELGRAPVNSEDSSSDLLD